MFAAWQRLWCCEAETHATPVCGVVDRSRCIANDSEDSGRDSAVLRATTDVEDTEKHSTDDVVTSAAGTEDSSADTTTTAGALGEDTEIEEGGELRQARFYQLQFGSELQRSSTAPSKFASSSGRSSAEETPMWDRTSEASTMSPVSTAPPWGTGARVFRARLRFDPRRRSEVGSFNRGSSAEERLIGARFDAVESSCVRISKLERSGPFARYNASVGIDERINVGDFITAVDEVEGDESDEGGEKLRHLLQEIASSDVEREFVITVHRPFTFSMAWSQDETRPSDGWGLELAFQATDKVLLIKKVHEDGAVYTRNRHVDPEHRVREGDFISKVNNKAGDAQQLFRQLVVSRRVLLVISRPAEL